MKLFASLLLGSSFVTTGQAALLGPSPYLSFADSPFQSLPFSYFHLETFEDGLFNVPGVTAISNTPGTTFGACGPGVFGDSVDGDDGVLDGLGTNGWSGCDPANVSTDDLGYTFVFSLAALGSFPTHVGLAWTDGSTTASTQFEAFDALGISLGVIGPVKISDGNFAGGTAEDRFFGVANPGGISKVTIRSPGGNNDLTIDHLQYGASAIPEPASLLLVVGGFAAFALFRAARSKEKKHRP
jgi:hypothetical protein